MSRRIPRAERRRNVARLFHERDRARSAARVFEDLWRDERVTSADAERELERLRGSGTPADLAKGHLLELTREQGRQPTAAEVRARMRLLRDAASELAAMVPMEGALQGQTGAASNT